MLQGLAKSICVNAKKTAADNTPAAVNWSNTRFNGISSYVYSAQQITSISTSITLQVVFSNTSYSTLYYKIQSTSTTPASGSPSTNGYTNILHNGTLTVSNNEWVVFGNDSAGSTTVTVKNTSDSDATLDTFTASRVK